MREFQNDFYLKNFEFTKFEKMIGRYYGDAGDETISVKERESNISQSSFNISKNFGFTCSTRHFRIDYLICK